MSEVKFLVQLDILIDKSGSFYLDIMFGIIGAVHNVVTHMFKAINPSQIIPTQYHWAQLPLLSEKCNAFGLAFNRVWICTKFEVVGVCILFAYL